MHIFLYISALIIYCCFGRISSKQYVHAVHLVPYVERGLTLTVTEHPSIRGPAGGDVLSLWAELRLRVLTYASHACNPPNARAPLRPDLHVDGIPSARANWACLVRLFSDQLF
jgi:hypothetical protein